MPVPGLSPCYRCGEYGHWESDLNPVTRQPECALRYRALSLTEHERRLQFHIDRYAELKISLSQKRQFITEEYDLRRNRNAPERKAS